MGFQMSKSNGIVELLKQINFNLSIIRKLSELQLRGIIKAELEKVASTSERKKIWALSDGTLSTGEIAKKVGVSRRAVQYFVQEAERSELLRMDKRGFPYRNIDWIPPEWLEEIGIVGKEKMLEWRNEHEVR